MSRNQKSIGCDCRLFVLCLPGECVGIVRGRVLPRIGSLFGDCGANVCNLRDATTAGKQIVQFAPIVLVVAVVVLLCYVVVSLGQSLH